MFWGNFPEKFVCPVFHGGSRLRIVSKRSKKSFKTPKTHKNLPNLSKSVSNMFWGTFFGNFFLPSVPWRVESSECFQKIKKVSKLQKRPKTFPNCPKVFWTCFGVLFSEIFLAQCSKEGRVFEMFFKIFQNSKDAQNRSQIVQTCFEHVLGQFFRKNFLPSVPWKVESSKGF